MAGSGAGAPRQQLRSRLIILLGAAVSAGLLVLALRRVDVGDAWRTARGANLGWLALGTIGVNIGLLPMALRWRTLSAGVAPRKPSTGSFLQAILCAQGVNNVIPARAGDVVRIVWLNRAAGAGAAAATASMIADRALDILALAVIIAIGFPFVPGRTWVTAVGIAALVGCVLLVGAWLASRRYVARHPDLLPAASGRLKTELRRFVTAFGGVLTWPRAARAAAWTVGIWGTWAVGAWAVARSIDIDLTIGQVLFVAAVLNVGLAIPSSPGFIGTYQWLVVAGVGLFGVDADQGFAFSVLLQLTWFVPQTLIGLSLLPRIGMSLAGVRQYRGAPIDGAVGA